ncbi:hypothetical protein Taro_020331 [Colocasia esculenta]|uniref:TF-B3 domain-containing protein n=1 Tax=Colocasia esculenta TaxID=4460 RepID=A0A843V4W9_COLES|nr:hypothetical protein [Colocasia esculenta]
MRSDVRWDARQLTRLLKMGRVAWGGYNRRENAMGCSEVSGGGCRAGNMQRAQLCIVVEEGRQKRRGRKISGLMRSLMAEAPGPLKMEAEETGAWGSGGLLALAMAACREQPEESSEEKKASSLAKQGSGVPICRRTLSVQTEAPVTPPCHGEWQKKRRVVVGPTRLVRRGWLAKAVEMGGSRPELVLKKRMFATDLSPHHTRLLLPCAHESDPSRGGVEMLLRRLTAAELGMVMGGEGLPVGLLDRWGREYGGAALRRWRSNRWFVVNGGGAWMDVVERNALREGDVVELFCFRAPAAALVGRGEGRVVLVVSAQVSVEEEMRRQREWWFMPAGISSAKARK